MAQYRQTQPNESIRAQILDNCTTMGFGSVFVVVMLSNTMYTGWVIQYYPGNRRLFLKGPPRSSAGAALESLLDATAEILAVKFAKEIQEFEESLSEQYGEGFILSDLAPTPHHQGGSEGGH